MEIRIGYVVSNEDVGRSGYLSVKLLGSDENADPISVGYTTPSFQVPDVGTEAKKFTGFVGIPNPGVYVLICKNPDDNRWYYLTSITGSASYQDLDSEDGTGGRQRYISPKGGGQTISPNTTLPFSENPESSVYSHNIKPQKYGLESPKGGKLLVSDSSNEDDLQYFTKVESQSGKRLMLDDVGDSINLKTEDGDGLKVTGHHYGEKVLAGPGPGPRSVTLEAGQNLFLEADSGSLNADVKGGYQLNLRNQSCNFPFLRPIPIDPKVGEVNIESNANSINIRTFNKEFIQDPASTSMPSKGVFIDASQYQGVVQIKAGKGGVEIWSDGDIDFNCAGSFNVNAVGDINLTGGSPFAINYWASQQSLNPAPPKYTTTGAGLINLNNPLGYTLKPIPTFNNDDLYPVN